MLRRAGTVGFLVLAMLASSGCVAIGKAILVPNFKVAVPASQLDPAPQPAAESPSIVAAPYAAAGPPPPTEAQATSAPLPHEVSISGSAGSMKIETVTVTGGKQLPHRVPDFSTEQVAAMVCIGARFGFQGESGKRAYAATLAAKTARGDLEAKRITQKQADDIELKRQAAVHAMMSPIPLLNLFGATSEKKSDLPPPRRRALVIEETSLVTTHENGKLAITVLGTVRNTGEREAELPAITLRALDDWGFSLAGQTSLLPFTRLKPGEARTFQLRFVNPPENIGEVYVHFAPPFIFRAPRDCDFFDPAKFDPDKPLGDTTQARDSLTAPKLSIGGIRRFIADSGPHVGATTPTYTLAELNDMTLHYESEATEAWRCRRNSEEGRCVDAEHRLQWRDMLSMAETIDAAWLASRDLEAAKAALAAGSGSQAALDAAEAKRAAEVAQFRAMGDAALARAGASLPGVVVEQPSSTLGYDGKTLYLDVAGTIRNTGAAPVRIGALMLAAVDRFGLPLWTSAAPYDATLEPGASTTFNQHVLLERAPPRQFDWSIKAGAMSGGAG